MNYNSGRKGIMTFLLFALILITLLNIINNKHSVNSRIYADMGKKETIIISEYTKFQWDEMIIISPGDVDYALRNDYNIKPSKKYKFYKEDYEFSLFFLSEGKIVKHIVTNEDTYSVFMDERQDIVYTPKNAIFVVKGRE